MPPSNWPLSTRRAIVIGRTRLAVDCLQVVCDAGDEVVGVIADSADDGTDGWQPSLRKAALAAGLGVLQPLNVNEAAFVAELAALRPDFILSFQAVPILRAPLIALPRVAALNLHYGLLPRYRGVSPIAWAIINGETETGVTLHHIDTGVDSGPIVASRPVPIGPADTGRDVYDRCVEAGVRLFADSWPLIREADTVTATPQDPAQALYYNRHSLDFGRRAIAWTDDAGRVANWMRAFIFPPFQYPELSVEGRICQVVRFEWDRGSHNGAPGQVLQTDDDGVLVGVPGGRIRMLELRTDGQPVPATELAELFPPGRRLAAPPMERHS